MGGCYSSRHQKFKELDFDDTYEREKWRDFVMAAMALNGPTS